MCQHDIVVVNVGLSVLSQGWHVTYQGLQISMAINVCLHIC